MFRSGLDELVPMYHRQYGKQCRVRNVIFHHSGPYLLSRLSSSCCHVLMSCSIYPVPTVQPRMPCPSCPFLVGPKSAVLLLFSLFCPGCLADVLSLLSALMPRILFVLSCCVRPVIFVLFRLSFPRCPVFAVLFRMSF